MDECDTLHDVFSHCLPAFGGAFLRRIYTILDRAIGMGCPLTVSIAGPVTVSGQHQAWLIPLLETGWVAYLSTTDAVCYHDGHRSLDAHKHGPIHEVPIFTDDAALRDERTIRVTDMAFDEDVLLDQDRFLIGRSGAARVSEEDDRAPSCATGWARTMRRRSSRTAFRHGLLVDLPPAGDSGVRRRARRTAACS